MPTQNPRKTMLQNTLILLTMLLLAQIPARAELGLALTPMRTELQISAGSQYTESLRLTNDGDEPVRVRGELLDWYMDETMTPQFAPRYEAEQEFSCRDWLQVNPREMDIPAAENFRVRYTIRVPEGTPEGEYHCGAGFVTMPPIQSNGAPMGMQIAVRAVAAFYVVVGDPESSPEFREFTMRPRQDGGWEAFAIFANEGLKHFRVDGFVELADEQGQVVDRVRIPTIPVLPKREQDFPIRLNASLSPGLYTLRTQADVGLEEILEAETTVRVE